MSARTAPPVPPPPRGAAAPPEAVPALSPEAFHALVAARDRVGLRAFLARYDMPLCVRGRCLFVTEQAPGVRVQLAGAFNGWQPGPELPSVPGLPRWRYAEVPLRLAAPVAYRLLLDGRWAEDASNRYFQFGPHGPNSAVYPPGRGRLVRLAGVHAPQLGNVRSLYVYLPAAYFEAPARRFPVLYLQDGFNVFSNPCAPFGAWCAERTADRLMARGEVAPALLVGIDTPDRGSEYLHVVLTRDDGPHGPPRLDAYAAFVADTVKPLIDRHFRTRPGPAATGIAGASLGGLAALYIGWRRPHAFGRVASLSGSFWAGEPEFSEAPGSALRDLIAETRGRLTRARRLRIYLDCGDSSPDGEVGYTNDGWVWTDWTRNALIAAGFSGRPEWAPAGQGAAPPANLPASTPPAAVPRLPYAARPPRGYAGFHDYLGIDRNLLALVGRGHVHEEAAWRVRFAAALRFLYPGPAIRRGARAASPRCAAPRGRP